MRVAGHRSFGKAWLAKVVASSLLALSLSISLGDLFIPFFWDRRLLVRIGFILLATILQAPLILPVLSRFNRPPVASLPAAQRFFRLTVWLLVVGLMVAVIVGGARHALPGSPVQDIAGLQEKHGFASDLLGLRDHIEEGMFLLAFFLFLRTTNREGEHPLARPPQRRLAPIVFLGVCYLAGYLFNTLLPMIDTKSWLFRFPDIGFVAYSPAGGDFRNGVYGPAKALLSGTYEPVQNKYPPLATALGLPYLLVSENRAYMVHVVSLLLLNVLCLWLAAVLANHVSPADARPRHINSQVLHVALFFLVLLGLFSSYPFLYSLERGNTDIAAMAFALGSMYVLLKHPSRTWLQVVLLSIAVHIKVYPAILFAALYYVKRSKIILPSLLVNGGLLFVLGPANAFGFLEIYWKGLPPNIWIGNHSADVFARYLALELDTGFSALRIMQIFFTGLPVLIWLTAWPALLRFKSAGQAALAGFMVSVPPMVVLPMISHDYKLVIVSCAVLVCLSFILVRMWTQQGVFDYLQLLLVAIAVFLIGRSNTLMHEWPRFLQNKYPWVVLLEIIMLIGIFQQARLGESESIALPAPE